MEIKIKAACAYFTPDGIVADTVSDSKYADYRVEKDACSFTVFASSEYSPAAVSVRIPVELNEGDAVFMNGFQSATDSRELGAGEKMNGVDIVGAYARHLYTEMFGGDYSIVKYKNKPGVTHGFSYCYFRSGDSFKLFASLDESWGYTVFKYDACTSVLKITRDIEGVKCFNDYKAISLFFAEGSEQEVFDAWFKKLALTDRHPAPALVGYSTAKLKTINESVIDGKLNAVKGCFPVKPNIYLIEGDYCTVGDWLTPYEKRFPSGLCAMADMIKEAGIMAGICISPFTVAPDSETFEYHKDWLLTTKNGRFIKTAKGLYVLDTENTEAREYVREVLHTILFMWGFDLVKLNDLYVAGIVPSYGKSRGEKMCSAMAFLRECCGGKLMYADHTPLMPAFGIADYCAISCDAVSDILPTAYTERFYRESASVKNASADIVFRRGLNKRAFLSAPCSISLDEKEKLLDGKLNNAEQNVLTNLSGLFTSVLVIHDTAAAYDQKKKRRFRRMCNLEKANEVKVERAERGFLVSYKYGGRKFVVKIK